MRGIRVSQGNIQVGDEHFLADVFTERRFATWHIGELHLSTSVRPNARRDGFEQTEQFECFMEYASALGKHLSHLCRSSSKLRSQVIAIERQLAAAEEMIDARVFIDRGHLARVTEEATEIIDNVEKSLAKGLLNGDFTRRLSEVRERLLVFQGSGQCLVDLLDGRKLRSRGKKELVVEICHRLVSEPELRRHQARLLELAVGPLAKPVR